MHQTHFPGQMCPHPLCGPRYMTPDACQWNQMEPVAVIHSAFPSQNYQDADYRVFCNQALSLAQSLVLEGRASPTIFFSEGAARGPQERPASASAWLHGAAAASQAVVNTSKKQSRFPPSSAHLFGETFSWGRQPEGGRAFVDFSKHPTRTSHSLQISKSGFLLAQMNDFINRRCITISFSQVPQFKIHYSFLRK